MRPLHVLQTKHIDVDQLQLASPCSAKWKDMRGDDRTRYGRSRFSLETFVESQYGVDEFWAFGGVDVHLPQAEARPLPSKEGMVVSVDREGRIFIDQTRVTYNDFRVTFRALVESRKPSGVYLRADQRVPYGDVVRVLAVIRNSGIKDVGLVAEEEDQTK